MSRNKGPGEFFVNHECSGCYTEGCEYSFKIQLTTVWQLMMMAMLIGCIWPLHCCSSTPPGCYTCKVTGETCAYHWRGVGAHLYRHQGDSIGFITPALYQLRNHTALFVDDVRFTVNLMASSRVLEVPSLLSTILFCEGHCCFDQESRLTEPDSWSLFLWLEVICLALLEFFISHVVAGLASELSTL